MTVSVASRSLTRTWLQIALASRKQTVSDSVLTLACATQRRCANLPCGWRVLRMREQTDVFEGFSGRRSRDQGPHAELELQGDLAHRGIHRTLRCRFQIRHRCTSPGSREARNVLTAMFGTCSDTGHSPTFKLLLPGRNLRSPTMSVVR